MASLNRSLPAVWAGESTLEVMQLLSLYIPFASGPHLRSLKANNTLSILANLYVETNGTATFSQIGGLLGAKVETVEMLASTIGQTTNSTTNAQVLQQTVLWAQSKLSQLPNYTPDVGYLALGIIFMTVTVITTALRLYQRSRLPAGLQLVDYALIVALAIAISMEGLFATYVDTLVLVKTGAIWFINWNTFVLLQIVASILIIIYHPCILFLKSSILVFYAQMTTSTYELCIIYFILTICVTSNFIGFFTAIFQWRPVDFWNHEFDPNPWAPRDKVLFAVGIINMVTDLLIWVMPIPTIIRLGQTWWHRIIAMAIIFSSAAACVFSILRVRIVWLGGLTTAIGSLSNFTSTTYAMLEINLAIITYNIPAIRVLYTNYMRQRRKRAQENSFHVQRGFHELGPMQIRNEESLSKAGSTDKNSDLTVNKDSDSAGHKEVV